MKKTGIIFLIIFSFLLTCLNMNPAFGELLISNGSQGLAMYTEDGISYLRLETEQKASGDESKVTEHINTSGTFYVDLQLRIPEESTAALSVFLQLQHATTTNGQVDWIMVAQARDGSWSINNNGKGSMAFQVMEGIMPTTWYTMRIIFEKGEDGYYHVIWNRLVSGIYQELGRFDLLDGNVTAIDSDIYLKQQAMSGDFGTGVKAVCDIAQFSVKSGDPSEDNSQIEQAVGSMELFGDVKSDAKRDTYALLYDLGMIQIYEDGTVREEEYLTRGNEALALSVLYGLDTASYQAMDSPYQDIPATDPQKGACLAAEAAGLLTTNNPGMFGIADPVSWEELITHLLNVLGYKDMLDDTDAGIQEYVSQARKIDLLRGVDFPADASAFVTRGEAAAILSSAIHIEPMKMIAMGEQNQYQILKDTNALEENANIYQKRGVLDANAKTGLLVYDPGLKENEVTIDGERYSAGSSNAADFLGQEVQFYYRYDEASGVRTILHIQTEKQVRIKEFTNRDIIQISSTEILVQEETRTKSYPYSSATHIVYNYKLAGSIASLSQLIGNLEEFNGRIIWICNSSGAADTLLIEQYKNIMLDGYNRAEQMLYNQYGENMVLPENEADVYCQKSNGKAAKLDDLKRGDLLSVLVSRPNANGKQIVTIIQNTESVSGAEVESLQGDGNNQTIKLNGRLYYIAPELRSAARPAMSPNDEDTDEMRQKASQWAYSAGTAAEFLLDAMGNVAGIRNRIVTEIGFIVKMAKRDDGFGVYNTKLKIFTSDGDMFEGSLKDRIIIDGVRYQDLSKASQYLADIKAASTVIRFRRTPEGKISLMDTYQTQTGGTNDCLVRLISGKHDWMRQSLSVMGNKIAIVGAYNFLIPHVGSSLYEDDTMFQNKKLEDYLMYDAYSSTGSGVVMDQNAVVSGIGAADILVQYYRNSDPQWDTFLIKDVMHGIDENGEETTMITAFVNGGGEQSYQLGKDVNYNYKLAPLLERGVIINPAYNAKGEIMDNIGRLYNGAGSYALVNSKGEAITQAADGSEISSNLNNTDSTGDLEYRNILGDIIQMMDQHLVIRLTNGNYEVINIGTAPVFVVDEKNIYAGTIGDLAKGKRIFVTMGKSQVKMLVIYE
ncbi:hypothetical protein INF28_10745 [Oscillospiraceae bacterium DSM 107454]|uniref:Uncharacterized protein n=1 Tax=Ructibacterium gallinarum TaxID=2779355 RepID=A0A9D5M7F3_9FIRM|nr:hypothetical protein [Ructibacterium gallinarum]